MKGIIIIPFRDTFKTGERFQELNTLIKAIRERSDIDVCVVHQDDDQLFNKAMLMNAGFDLTKSFDYFIFHDVDNIPKGGNPYGPRICSGILQGKLDGEILTDKDDHWAGAIYFTREDFIAINGFSNLYWGWGWEISAVAHRFGNIKWKRFDGEFEQLRHETKHRYTGNPNWVNNALIYYMLDNVLPSTWDGLSELEYCLNSADLNLGFPSYHIGLPAPKYDVSRNFTLQEIVALGGADDLDRYNWIVETYSK
jgi:beta-1,4-galactosyltransferase 1